MYASYRRLGIHYGWAMGNYGTILTSGNGGRTWQVQTNDNFEDVGEGLGGVDLAADALGYGDIAAGLSRFLRNPHYCWDLASRCCYAARSS